MYRILLTIRVLLAQTRQDWLWSYVAGAPRARGTAPVPTSYRREPIRHLAPGAVLLAVLQHLAPEYERPPVLRQRRPGPGARVQLATRRAMVTA